MWVSQVRLAADAYHVCLHHALTTEKEEVMGLLVGTFSEVLLNIILSHRLQIIT